MLDMTVKIRKPKNKKTVALDNVILQLSTKWEITTCKLRYVLGFRNDDLLTIGGHVLAVPSIEHHLVGGLTLVGYCSYTIYCSNSGNH